MHTPHLKQAFRAVLLVAFLCLATAQAAGADFRLENAGASLTGSDGQFSRQAGAHADFTAHFELSRTGLDTPMRDARVDLPPGLVGNATIAPTCPLSRIISNGTPLSDCPVGSAVGWARIETYEKDGILKKVVYNATRPGSLPALFAFNYLGAAVRIEPRVRPGDYGITADSVAVTQAITPVNFDVTFWGVPASPSHDLQRSDSAEAFPLASQAQPVAFMSNPTSCSATPATFTVSVDSWANPGAFLSESVDRDREGTPFVFTGCDRVPFNPAVAVKQQSQAAAAPMGLDVGLEVPQGGAPNALASAHVRKTVVTFPKGMSISPGAASGQGACSEAQIGIGSNAAPTCPDSSRLGTVAIKTPLLDEELEGSLYLAEQRNNPFGSMFAAYLAVKGPGFYLKLPGRIEADPSDGQLTTTFDNLPQLPFEKASITLRGGAGAPLVAPTACGTHNAQIQMTSWASPAPVTLEAPIAIDQNCSNGGFDPALKAGTTNPAAGAFSPFLLRVIRQDGEQNVSRIDATLPEGLLAKLAGVPRCGDAQAATGACPAASQIGTTTVAVGAGPTPLYVPEAGKAPTAIYLAGPYKGAPYSLVVKVQAQAGPFDLGTVVVRSAIAVDPVSAQVSVKSDPLPQILQGIPIAYRDVRVEVNRPGFMLNPTGCAPAKIAATVVSSQGALAAPSVRFGVAGCRELGFKPKLALSLKGGTKRGQYPALRAVLTARKGDANIARASVALPHSEFLAQNHIRTVCTRVQFAAGAGNGAECPKGSIYGFATATTPLLDEPLSGPVYLRSSRNPLPDLVAALHGQIDVDLVGRIDSKNGGIRTSFDAVPDAPVSKFVLTMRGGKKGLLENSLNLCRSTNRAAVLIDAQNGKTADSTPLLANSCTAAGKGKKPGNHGRGAKPRHARG
jgi:hypothetical protein